ncbi:Ldh family oxidoreductase [Halorussus salinisoli]|uniref:Ldh family oxidoreductase n=1 Tax=Halorussus salinisoli TaxID=2558242 RepID=UPI0010C20959|nr:Ldh family oxidoreductase [Halorussus salinisoli]
MANQTEHAVRIDPDRLRTFASDVFGRAGLSEEHADIVADTLVDANLRGIDTHGVVRLEPYVERLEEGGINASPEPSVSQSGGAGAAIVNGDDGPGQVATLRAMEEAIDRASDNGSAFVGVRNSNHFGTASYYTNYATERGYVGIAMTHAGPNVTPFGGADPYFGTNPISFGLPNGDDFPITLDMATSVTAKGNVILAEEEGEDIPSDWAVDEEGNPTTDPAEFHALRPMAGPKGYGLAFVIDAFCGVLMDTVFGDDVPTMYHDVSSPQKLGHFVGAVDVESFTSLGGFADRMQQMVDDLKELRTAEDFGEVLVPGEPEARTKAERLEDGVPLGEGVWDTLQTLGAQYHVQLE